MRTVDGTGSIVPLLTPLNSDESVNFEQLDVLVDHVITGGVDALLVMGSTGEFARFSPDTRGRIIARAVERAGGRVPVYAGIGDTGLKNVLHNLALAEKAGADAIAATLPYYYPIRNDQEAYSYYKAVAETAQVPVMLYNIPSTCGASLSLAMIEKMLHFPSVIGIKDSAGDLPRFMEELRLFHGLEKPFAIVVGAEELTYEGLKAGADGVVPSMANPFPRLWSDIMGAARKNDFATVRTLCNKVDEFNCINQYADAWMSPNVWRKRALHMMGICNDYCTAPYVPVDAQADEQIRQAIAWYEKQYAGIVA